MHKIGTQSDRQFPKWGSSAQEPPYHAQIWEYPLQGVNKCQIPTYHYNGLLLPGSYQWEYFSLLCLEVTCIETSGGATGLYSLVKKEQVKQCVFTILGNGILFRKDKQVGKYCSHTLKVLHTFVIQSHFHPVSVAVMCTNVVMSCCECLYLSK